MRINTFQSWLNKFKIDDVSGYLVGAGPYTTLWENGKAIYIRPIMWFDELDCYYTGIETVDSNLIHSISTCRQFDCAENAARDLAAYILNYTL